MKKQIVAALAAAAAMACGESDQMVDLPSLSSSSGVENAADAASREYAITITNLTTGQPFSPGVIVTHTKQTSFFEVGDAASEGLRLIAENGDPSVAASELIGAAGVDDVVATTAPVHRVGGPGPTDLSTTVAARANADRFSLAVMLICSNDGFVGVDGARLPTGYEPVTYYASGYDAGTEVNDELSASIVDACPAIGPLGGDADGNGRAGEGGTVQLHPTIQGGAFLDPSLHGWTEPVASVTVQRIR